MSRRIYLVEPTGPIEDDPDLTNKKFRGNPTKAYRSLEPLLVTSEITDWQGHSPEALKAMKNFLEQLDVALRQLRTERGLRLRAVVLFIVENEIDVIVIS